MTKLTNIKEILKPYFTLRSEKEEVWLDYLCEETNYVNGGVYFHHETPVYHKQRVLATTFESTSDNVKWNLIMKDSNNIVSSQFKNARLFIDNTELFNPEFIIKNDNILTVVLPKYLSGELDISFPSVNERLNHYQGLIYKTGIRSQELHLKQGANFVNDTVNKKLTFTVELTNPCKNQQLECVTMYRNGNTNDTTKKVIYLNGSDTVINIEMNRGSQDVGVKVDLKPVTVNNINYLGNEFIKSF